MKKMKLTLLGSVAFLLLFSSAYGKSKKEDCFEPNKNGAGSAAENGQYFGPIDTYNKALLKTAVSAMTHSCAITQEKKSFAFSKLSERGWQFVNEAGEPSKNGAQGIMEMGPGRAYVAYHPKENRLIVVFRGTGVKGDVKKLVQNAILDASMRKTQIGWLPKQAHQNWKGLTTEKLAKWSKLEVHSGFNRNYLMFEKSLVKRVGSFLASNQKKPEVYCIGFSLGAALATHCAAHLSLRFGLQPNLVVGASPRVGDKAFRAAFDKEINHSLRIMLEKDPVAQIPGNLLKESFEHVGKKLLPMYHDSKLGRRLSVDSLTKLTHSWTNARVLADIVRFKKYHHYLRYKEALRVQIDRCDKHCQDGILSKLARTERKASSKGRANK